MEELIKPKDLILLYLDEKREFLIQVQQKLRLSTDHGDINLSEIIDKPYGFVGKTHLGTEFYCLKPTTSDLMLRVKRTTTIVYPKDFGYLLLETSIGPGSKVIEVGTGSGALTMVLAKLVAPDGKVHSYERREEFLENAQKNLARTGYMKNVEFFCCDVSQEGVLQKGVDAIFIDVPEPWEVIPKVAEALKGGHHLVSLSPNIEQVKRTVDAMKAIGFMKIRVCENFQREILVRERGVRPKERGITHTAYLTSGYKIQEES